MDTCSDADYSRRIVSGRHEPDGHDAAAAADIAAKVAEDNKKQQQVAKERKSDEVNRLFVAFVHRLWNITTRK
jgi:hypothetical protein